MGTSVDQIFDLLKFIVSTDIVFLSIEPIYLYQVQYIRSYQYLLDIRCISKYTTLYFGSNISFVTLCLSNSNHVLLIIVCVWIILLSLTLFNVFKFNV
jgi:hypothetical protein